MRLADPLWSGTGRVNPERSARARPWRRRERGGSFVGCAFARPKVRYCCPPNTYWPRYRHHATAPLTRYRLRWLTFRPPDGHTTIHPRLETSTTGTQLYHRCPLLPPAALCCQPTVFTATSLSCSSTDGKRRVRPGAGRAGGRRRCWFIRGRRTNRE